MKKAIALLGIAALLGAVPAGAGAQQADKSDNVTLEATFPYTIDESDPFFSSGTDIDFSGPYIYAMQQGLKPGMGGAVHIFKATKKKVTKVSSFPCGGEQNDVAVVKPGLLAIGYHDGNCAPAREGLLLLDVKNPKKPKLLGSVEMAEGTHTITTYPGEDIVYAAPGGLANADGETRIIDVSDPTKPEIAATFTSSPIGCHDISFHIAEDEQLAFCPGAVETQIWDVSDPLAPSTIGHIPNPTNTLQHTAYPTHDGKFLAVTDEAAEVSDCAGGPLGNVWLYDISNRQLPTMVSTFDVQRGEPINSPNSSPATSRSTWCSAHNGGFIPGTYQLVLSWYSAGFNVIDYTDPGSPAEIAHHDGEDNYWSAYWYKGRIYANDREFGKLDVFKVEGITEGKV